MRLFGRANSRQTTFLFRSTFIWTDSSIANQAISCIDRLFSAQHDLVEHVLAMHLIGTYMQIVIERVHQR